MQKEKHKYTFRYIQEDNIPWNIIENTYDGSVYKTQRWINFLKKNHFEPFIIEISTDDTISGYFVSELVKIGFLKILASSMKGMSSGSQGLSMLKETSTEDRLIIYRQLSKYVFRNNIAHLIIVKDWIINCKDIEHTGIHSIGVDISFIDLTPDEETLYKRLEQKSCRTKIHKAIRNGLKVIEVKDPEEFLATHIKQFESVSERHGIENLGTKSILKDVLETNYPDQTLMLKVITEDGINIASGLYLIGNGSCCSFSSSNFKEYLKLCPTELLRWEAIKICKQRGAKYFFNNGTNPFKLKFGSTRIIKPTLFYEKYPGSFLMYQLALKIYNKTTTRYRQQWKKLKALLYR